MEIDKEDLVCELFGHEDAPFIRHPLPELTPAEATFFMVYALDAEVKNGGLYQFFGNTTVADYLKHGDLIAALESIGATRAAGLMRQASEALFGSPTIPPSRIAIEIAIDGVDDEQIASLGALDDLFYEEDLPSLLYDFAEKHQASIRGAASIFHPL